jgi:hypothetical protein
VAAEPKPWWGGMRHRQLPCISPLRVALIRSADSLSAVSQIGNLRVERAVDRGG